MNKIYAYLISFLLVAMVATGVYAAFYTNVPVKLSVKEPLQSDLLPIEMELYAGESNLSADEWEITNNGSGFINIKVTFDEVNNTCTSNSYEGCVVTYSPIMVVDESEVESWVLGYPVKTIPAEGIVKTLAPGESIYRVGLSVPSGSEVGNVEGNFVIERI